MILKLQPLREIDQQEEGNNQMSGPAQNLTKDKPASSSIMGSSIELS